MYADVKLAFFTRIYRDVPSDWTMVSPVGTECSDRPVTHSVTVSVAVQVCYGCIAAPKTRQAAAFWTDWRHLISSLVVTQEARWVVSNSLAPPRFLQYNKYLLLSWWDVVVLCGSFIKPFKHNFFEEFILSLGHAFVLTFLVLCNRVTCLPGLPKFHLMPFSADDGGFTSECLINIVLQLTVKKTLGTFKRTHLDNWHDHKQKFTDDQLVVLTELLVSPNYYA